MSPRSSVKPLPFSKAFEELEGITRWFEEGSGDLEEGLKKFERGLELAQVCKRYLSQVENRIREIKDRFSETVLDGEETLDRSP